MTWQEFLNRINDPARTLDELRQAARDAQPHGGPAIQPQWNRATIRARLRAFIQAQPDLNAQVPWAPPTRPAAPPPPVQQVAAPPGRPNRWLIATIVLGVVLGLFVVLVTIGWSGTAEPTERADIVTKQVTVEVTRIVEKEKIVEKPVEKIVEVTKEVPVEVTRVVNKEVEVEVVVTATPGPTNTPTPTTTPTLTPTPTATPTVAATAAVTQTVTAVAVSGAPDADHWERLERLDPVFRNQRWQAWLSEAGITWDSISADARQIEEETSPAGQILASGLQVNAVNLWVPWPNIVTTDVPSRITETSTTRKHQPDLRNASVLYTNVYARGPVTVWVDGSNWGQLVP